MPINFVVVRASSIPSLVKDEESDLKAGLTGSDILWESGIKDSGEEIPIYELTSDAKKSQLYVGVTDRFRGFTRELRVSTKYPKIATEYFKKKNEQVNLFFIPGSDEAMQYVFKDCDALVGITSTGETASANNIIKLEVFYDVTLRMIQASDKMSRRDRDILDDLRERIAVAVQRKRMI